MRVCVHIAVPFTLSEVRIGGVSRLFFTEGDPTDTQYGGTFTLREPGLQASETVTIYALVSSDYCASDQLEQVCQDGVCDGTYRVILKRPDHTNFNWT